MAKKAAKKNVQKNGIMINGQFSDVNGAIICLYDIISTNEKERINEINHLISQLNELKKEVDSNNNKTAMELDGIVYSINKTINYLIAPWWKKRKINLIG